jgi:hypothetical protein
MYFQDVAGDWSADDRSHLMCARIKQAAANYGGHEVPLTVDEERLSAKFEYPIHKWHTPGRPSEPFVWGVTGVSQPIDSFKLPAARRANDLMQGKYHIDRKTLRNTVSAALTELLGKPSDTAGGTRTYWKRMDGVWIATVVDYTPRQPLQLRYGHEIWRASSDGERSRPAAGDRIVRFEGIHALLGRGQSEWRYMQGQDIASTAILLRDACQWFLDAVPGFLRDAQSPSKGER